jgi:hypothetical protein
MSLSYNFISTLQYSSPYHCLFGSHQKTPTVTGVAQLQNCINKLLHRLCSDCSSNFMVKLVCGQAEEHVLMTLWQGCFQAATVGVAAWCLKRLYFRFWLEVFLCKFIHDCLNLHCQLRLYMGRVSGFIFVLGREMSPTSPDLWSLLALGNICFWLVGEHMLYAFNVM